MKIVLVTGGFDPLHSGHISYFKAAKELGNYLIVGVNSDAWLESKKGRSFMPISERANIIDNLSVVDEVFAFDNEYDADGTCVKFIEDVLKNNPNAEVIFANGGDRTKTNIPEMCIEDSRLKFEFGVGGNDKKNSSSWILREWKYDVEKRIWGEFSNLFEDDAVKVKELIIQPNQGISYQRHFKRSEIWFVSKGVINIKHSFMDPSSYIIHTLKEDEVFTIRQGEWHQAYNTTDRPCHIIEIQYGEETSEDDIERLEYYTHK